MAIAVTASRHAEVGEVHAHVQGKFRCACSRCADPIELTVDTEFDHHFVGPGQLDAGDEFDAEAADLDADPDVSEHDGANILLDELCIEHTILALPDVPLCNEDCKGLCPRCGINRNTETCTCDLSEERSSPWAKLAELRVQKNLGSRVAGPQGSVRGNEWSGSGSCPESESNRRIRWQFQRNACPTRARPCAAPSGTR